MEKDKKKVLIVGAGLAGLAMYLALNKRKFDVEIIEKRKKFKRLGYALIFMPLGVKALRIIGFTHTQINSLGRNVQENRVRNKDGKLTFVNDFRPLIKKFGNYMMVTREKLYKLLESRVSTKDIRFGVGVKSFSQLAKKVHVKFSGSKKNNKYDIVIGADGVYSFVRQTLFPHIKLDPVGLSLIWAWIPRKEGVYPEQPGDVGNEKAGVGFFNSGERGRSCMAFFFQTKDVPSNITPKDYKNLLRKHLKDFGGPVPKILKHLPSGKEMYLHDDYELNLKRWYRSNVVLIGDAAHARSVFSGAGSALALEDALVLGHYLNQKDNVRVAIKKYYQKQRSRVEKLAMSRLRPYFKNQKGVTKYLGNFFTSSLLYSRNRPETT